MTIAFYLKQWPNSKAPHSVALAGAWKVVVSARPGNAAGQGGSHLSTVLGGLNKQMDANGMCLKDPRPVSLDPLHIVFSGKDF